MLTIYLSDKGMPGVYRIEMQVTAGSGKLAMPGLWNSTAAKEKVKMAFDYFKANASRTSGARKVLEHDFHLHVVDYKIAVCCDIFRSPAWLRSLQGW
ncbi:hypothetical protein [Halomonas sp. MS1]|nr:hypothetical protein [Halomonas sp. MS1]UTD55103.1 hypothetical protein NF683_18445 [Halomonas sp. MS1]